MEEHQRIEPLLNAEQRQELAGISYLLAQCETLRARGLIGDEAHRTIAAEYLSRREAIETAGQYEAEIARARRLMTSDPLQAMGSADRARQLGPERPEGWVLAIEGRQGSRDDEAEALAAEAVARFPGFPITPADLRHQREVRQARADRERAESGTAQRLAEARHAVDSRRDADAVALCRAIHEQTPDHLDSHVLLAFALQRLGRLDEAMTAYRRLQSLQPENPVWADWVKDVALRLAKGARLPSEGPTPERGTASARPRLELVPAQPAISWSSVAGEFLKDHWQKLILCLAVLLIVVSTNVGVYQLVGPKLWSPAGKCVLALVYTAMFAALGRGLARWGAERAGRMMLVTTLILVPFSFMLAGESGLLSAPTASRLAVLLLDAAALGGLIWWVVSALGPVRGGGGTLAVGLFALCATDVAASPGGLQPLMVFFLPSLLFVAAVWRINTRAPDADEPGATDFQAIALGTLGFAFLTATLRIGLFVLHLAPTMFAVPVMIAALAAVHTARHLERRKQEPDWALGLRFGWIVVSALGFALALARPPELSPVYSGNTLAAALLGLGLYAWSLRAYRQPAYLYFCFGALFLSYFGAYYFVADLIRSVEEAARHALGYRQKLPAPFKAINGLVFNSVLAGLSLLFAKRWGDGRLARHAHYIGVPFSIAACVFSGFEPTAALICLSGYAVLYAIGTYLFAVPWVVYLASAAVVGAVHFGTTLVPGWSLGPSAVLASALGLGFWLVERGLRWRRAPLPYLRPLIHAALALMALAIAEASWARGMSADATLAAASTFLLAGLLAVLIGLDEPRGALAILAVIAVNFGLGLLVPHLDARWRLGMGPAAFALAAMTLAVAQAALSDRLARAQGRFHTEHRIVIYVRPILWAGFAQVALGLGFLLMLLAGLSEPVPAATMAGAAVALTLGAVAIVILLRLVPRPELAHLATAMGLGAWLALAAIANGGAFGSYPYHGAAMALYALGLLAATEWGRKWLGRIKSADPEFAASRPVRVERLAATLPDFAIVVAFVAVVIAEGTTFEGIAAFRSLPLMQLDVGLTRAAALALSGAVLLGATRFRRRSVLVYCGLALAVGSLLDAVTWFPWFSANSTAPLAWITPTAALSAIGLWAIALAIRPRDGGEFYAVPCLRTASVLTAWVVPLAVLARLATSFAFEPSLIALILNIAASLLLSTVQRRPRLTYRAVVSLFFAVYVTLFSLGKTTQNGLMILSLASSLQAILWTIAGLFCARRPVDSWLRTHATPLFRSALFLTALAIAPGCQSPTAMLVIALAFLPLVKGFATTRWVYAATAALGWAAYQAFLTDVHADRLIAALMIGAYELWALGVFVRRVNPALRHWLDLPGLAFDLPLFNSALAAGLIATLLATDEASYPLNDWGTTAGLALNLAVLAVLMLKPYPNRGWVHAAVVLGSLSAVFSTYELRVTWHDALPLGLALAIVWRLVFLVVRRYEGALCRRFAVVELGYGAILEVWSRGFLAIAGAITAFLIIRTTLVGVFDPPLGVENVADGLRGWWSVVVALGLAAVALGLEFHSLGRSALVRLCHALAVLLLWWLLNPVSPLGPRIGPRELAAATALAALATAALCWRLRDEVESTWDRSQGDVDSEHFGLVGAGLALVALAFTKGHVHPQSILTLGLATAAFGAIARARGSVWAVRLAALAWGGTCVEVALALSWRLGFESVPERAIPVALGGVSTLLTLWGLAVRFRRERPAFALAVEQVVVLAAFLATIAVWAGTITGAGLSGGETYAGVGVLLAVAAFATRLAWIWKAEWLVYAGQLAMLGAYFVYRAAFPLPVATDAALLTLLGYLDFGVSETMRRLRLTPYTRPTLYVSLALPVLPLVLMIGTAKIDDATLFILFSVATFYAVACFRMQWKRLGYAAAVLYNAFLWVVWARVGWALSDHPQLFLVPVGFTAILFAEVNRRELGRASVNAIRGVGLVLIYLSLSYPIWQYQSFGAWLALLLLSLLGIFAGIGLRVQTFVWLGLVVFTLDVVYQLGRMGLEYTLAKWAIMLALGLLLILFVALNEKKRIVLSMRAYYLEVRRWE